MDNTRRMVLADVPNSLHKLSRDGSFVPAGNTPDSIRSFNISYILSYIKPSYIKPIFVSPNNTKSLIYGWAIGVNDAQCSKA